jgi:mycofactocin precursor
VRTLDVRSCRVGNCLLPVALGVISVGPSDREPDHPGGIVPETTQDETQTAETPTAIEESLVQESLVEEVSIDGMCGVY